MLSAASASKTAELHTLLSATAVQYWPMLITAGSLVAAKKKQEIPQHCSSSVPAKLEQDPAHYSSSSVTAKQEHDHAQYCSSVVGAILEQDNAQY
jgi:hypothetical protein